MKKKEFIEKVKNLILNKVRFHAPNLVSDSIDFELLNVVGIDATYPIFVFSKPLDNTFFRAFKLAKKEADFNLILNQKPLVSNRKVKSLDKTKILYEDEIGSNLYYTLDGLNVNYIAKTLYEKKLRQNYLKINEKEINFDFCPYFYHKKIAVDGVVFEGKEFLLNGRNFDLSFLNPHDEKRKIEVEFNLPLARGYYVFKKGINFIEIENLTTKEKAYFNYQSKDVSFSFSSVDGLESSTFACINVRCKVDLEAKQVKHIFFNYGQEKFFFLSLSEVKECFLLSQKKMQETFDTMITSSDKSFDEYFNLSLPQKIWESWEKMTINEQSENEWLKIKSNILKMTEKGAKINSDFKGLREVRLFRNNRWKRVFIVHGENEYLYDGKTKYFNFSLLTKEILSQNNEIYLSFRN